MPKLMFHHRTLGLINRLAAQTGQGYLFQGPKGVGKFTLAIEIAKGLNCTQAAGIESCGRCVSCQLIEAGSFPDVVTVKPESDTIALAQIHELVRQLTLVNYLAGGWRFVIIDEADSLTPEAQNALLKVLEEPPPRTTIILISHNSENLLPTVRSRLQTFNFGLIKDAEIERWLTDQGLASGDAKVAAKLSAGRLGAANRLAHDPAALDQVLGLASLAAKIGESDLAGRLGLASKLTTREQSWLLLQALTAEESTTLKDKPNPTTTRRLDLLERTARYIQHNVAPRTAMESLLVDY